ncbi:hypothetical protein ACFLTI_08810 [Bacteroidota bacterium]
MKKLKYNSGKLLLIFLLLLMINNQLVSQNQTYNTKNETAPVKIFYGLNESHSRSWAQCADKGLVGISFFNKTEGRTGNLISQVIDWKFQFFYTIQNQNHIFLWQFQIM